MRYLYPQRKRFEILSAMFAGGLGVHIWATALQSNPLIWAGFSQADSLRLGVVMAGFGMIHALGVRINGNAPKLSTALRIVGMAGHAVAFGLLALHGFGQTAIYTYGWGFALMLYGASSALRDTLDAWGRNWSKA